MSPPHTEFFGPDLGRGPFAAYRIETAAVQIATALAQVRAPLTRSDDDLLSHATFIRELADHLAPDWAAQISIDISDENLNIINTTIRAAVGTYSLLDCWLCDDTGGGLTSGAPATVTFSTGTILETVVTRKRYIVITPANGVVNVSVGYTGVRSWRWAVSRYGRVYYSNVLDFR